MSVEDDHATTIIGGSDGPTAIHSYGKIENKNLLSRMKHSFFSWKYHKKRERVIKKIKPGTHTSKELIQYLKEHYNAQEVKDEYPCYKKRKRQMKYSLIQQRNPELIGGSERLSLPADADFSNDEFLKEWIAKANEWNHTCMDRIDLLSEEVFPIEYHLFVIENDETIEIEFEEIHGQLGFSWSGTGRISKNPDRIIKDIYLFYGVSQEDIDQSTERYNALVFALTKSNIVNKIVNKNGRNRKSGSTK